MLPELASKLIPARFQAPASLAYRWLVSRQYVGNSVECPCCGGHFTHFLPRGKRLNAVCPRCRSNERHRLFWLYVTNKTNFLQAHLKVLHFAPEWFSFLRIKPLENLDYLSVDLDSPRAMARADITNMQFSDNTFDVIVCSHVLEHVPDDTKAMRELYRVLKPGGWAILLVPVDINRPTTLEDPTITDPENRQRYYGHPGHVRQYGLDYEDRLRAAGFHVQVDYYARSFPPEQVQRYGLLVDEAIYFCTKDAS